MAGLGDILKMLPIDQIAQSFGVDNSTATQAVEEGSATILTGLAKNASTPEGSAAIEAALGKHAGQGDSVDVSQVDTADGGKILKHIFGDKQEQVTQELTQNKGTAGIDFGKLLPMLAPVIMGALSKSTSAQQSNGGGGIMDAIGGLLGGGNSGGGGGIMDMLGGLFGGGGAQPQQTQQASGGGLQDILGGLLGGGNNDGKSGGGIMDALGGLFGGKK